MPFQPINFANIDPIGNPGLRNLVGNFISGYKSAQVPAALERQKKQEELMNAFNAMKLQNEPQRLASEMEGRGLENALKKLTLQQQPQRFASQMQGQDILNQLNKSRLQYEPTKQDLMNQIHKAQLQKLANPFSNLSKEERTIEGLRNIEERYGKDSPQVEFAKRLSLGKNYPASSGNNLTTGSVNDIQKQIRAIDSLIPMIEDLKSFEEPSFVSLNPNLKARYSSKVNPAIDKYIGAFKLPQVKESIPLAKEILHRSPGETTENYHGRLDTLFNDLMRQKSILEGTYNKLLKNNTEKTSKSNNDPLGLR